MICQSHSGQNRSWCAPEQKPPPLLSRSTNTSILSQIIILMHFPHILCVWVRSSFETLHTDFLFTSYSLCRYFIILKIQIFISQLTCHTTWVT
jgi:hypothetical protein